MAIFRSKSGKEIDYETHKQVDYKTHTANVHDPILSAVNEAQPFQEAADISQIHRRPTYLSHESGTLKDVFGQQISQGDMSNPTRARNERPLDTIRGFEYAITGDMSYRDQLESNRLGWGFHDDFAFNSLIPNGNGNQQEFQQSAGGMSRPQYNFSDQPMYSTENYSASSLKNSKNQKKKKGGLFGRKK